MGLPFLSVVVPAFNEEGRIARTISQVLAELERLAVDAELIVVDDGSTDRTASRVADAALADARVTLVRAGHAGKGAAVRRGMLAARGTWRFLADADLSMPISELARFLDAAQRGDGDIFVGSREAAGARRIGEPWVRHAIGRVFNWMVKIVVLRGIDDTQCGFKLFSAEAATALFPRTTIAGFAFDVEVLTLARLAGYGVREVGIEWHCRPDSRVSAWRGAAAFADILRVRWNSWTGRYRGIPAPAASGPAELERVCC